MAARVRIDDDATQRVGDGGRARPAPPGTARAGHDELNGYWPDSLPRRPYPLSPIPFQWVLPRGPLHRAPPTVESSILSAAAAALQPVSLERPNKSERATKTGDPARRAAACARAEASWRAALVRVRRARGGRGCGGGGGLFSSARGPSHMARSCVRASDDLIVPSLSRHKHLKT